MNMALCMVADKTTLEFRASLIPAESPDSLPVEEEIDRLSEDLGLCYWGSSEIQSPESTGFEDVVRREIARFREFCRKRTLPF